MDDAVFVGGVQSEAATLVGTVHSSPSGRNRSNDQDAVDENYVFVYYIPLLCNACGLPLIISMDSVTYLVDFIGRTATASHMAATKTQNSGAYPSTYWERYRQQRTYKSSHEP